MRGGFASLPITLAAVMLACGSRMNPHALDGANVWQPLPPNVDAGYLPRGSIFACFGDRQSSALHRVRLRGGGADANAHVRNAEDNQQTEGYDEIPMDVLTEMGREAIGEKKYCEAANCLSAALARMVERHGELASECAQLYYLYGSALALEAEENDDALFGPSVPSQLPIKGLQPNASSTDALEQNEEGDAGSEEGNSTAQDDGDPISANSAEAGSGVAEKADQGYTEGVDVPQAEGEADAGVVDSQGEKQSDRDDPRERAWQVLDIARVILERSIKPSTENSAAGIENVTKKQHLMLSDVYMRLGDLHLHSECYNASYMDYRECLAIRESVCALDDRSVMEAHYVSAMAKLYGGDKDAALAHFRAAAHGCRQRILREKEKGVGREESFTQILKDIETRIEEEAAPNLVNISALRESLRQKVTLPGYTAADEEAAEEIFPVPLGKATKRKLDDKPVLAPQGGGTDGSGSIGAELSSLPKKARKSVPWTGKVDAEGVDDADLY